MNASRRSGLRTSIRIAGGCLCAALLMAGCGDKTATKDIDAVDISGEAQPRDFELTDHTGQRRRLSEFRGKVVALFFGYTQCPDVCPTTLAEFIQVRRALGAKADQLQVLFVTVDPERDTPRLLAEYMRAFDPSFIGLYGSQEELKRMTGTFAVSYVRIPGTTNDSYTLDHTAYVFLVDPAGRLRLKVPHGQPAAALVRLIQEISEPAP